MKRLRAKLITIPWELEVPTLSLASLAAATPPQFDVCIVDLLRERLVLDEPVDLVGISASTPRINAAYELARRYRERGVTVVLGGHHVTALPDEALAHADAVVCGEGEASWRRICEQMLVDRRQVGGVYHEEPDLDDLSLPRTDLMKLRRYQAYYYPVIATRGCSESCSFCFAKRMTRGYRAHPIRYVLEQIRRRPQWVKAMYFVDDNLAADMDYTRALFTELAKDPFPFGMQVRHEFSQNPDNIELARRAGCILISSGYESLNQRSLDRTGKRATASYYREIVERIQSAGIIASGNWMFGFDWDEPELFEATWGFLRDSKMMHSSFTVEIPFPGTPGFRRYRREGRLLTENYERYTGRDSVVHRPARMTPEQLARGIRWLTLKYHSLAHRTRLARAAWRNDKLFCDFTPSKRALYIGALNYFQVWQWRYRMTPSIAWLYGRLAPLYKYRHVGDLLRRTNFWAPSEIPADSRPVALSTSSPFAERAGAMAPGRGKCLQPSRL
ncbi:MAG: B12-binding domain-containing radical SAM protein [Myxococcales bacterium]|nr:B12-binding domain-containing radical SAM protein [Myxococcales bacterium]